jgi:transitional endoplasmic reticulum ATPase
MDLKFHLATSKFAPEEVFEDDLFDDDPTIEAQQNDGQTQLSVGGLITRGVDSDDLQALVSPELQYGLGLRTIVLRTLLKTSASYRLLHRGGQSVSRVADFLGFENYERYLSGRTSAEIRKELNAILTAWESEQTELAWLPSPLRDNLNNLGEIVGLNAAEKTLLGFSVLVHAEPILESTVDLMGSDLAGFAIQRPLSQILGLSEQSVQDALSRNGKLFQSGLLTIEHRSRYDLKQLLDLLTPTFHSRMVVPQTDIRSLVEGFVKPATEAKVALNRFSHVANLVFMVREYLKQSLFTGKPGANVLIYGPPGTGKSQLARAVAHDLGVQLLEVSPTNLAGAAVAPIRRIRNYRIAQSFYGNSSNVLLFDEVEEVFTMLGNDRSDDETTIPQKSFLNALLESTKIPTIWIANNLEQFDPAYLRRFDICIEMPVPSRSTRLAMLQDAFKGAVSDTLVDTISHHDKVSPALIQQVAEVSAALASNDTVAKREECVVTLLNQKLRAQGSKEVHYKTTDTAGHLLFDPGLLNCAQDLRRIVEGLKTTKVGRLCLYGPPGTGKTAFGKWVAQSLDLTHMVVSGSTLRGCYVGDTEKNIAKAFAAGKAEGAVLQLDEIDTFLADRSRPMQEHEIAHINEMLVQMENYEGVFIASTNLMDNLDDAALRRFDLAVKFNYLKPEAVLELFGRCAALLAFDATDTGLIGRLQQLRGLTPGDFDQALRRGRLTGFKDAAQFVEALEQASFLKKGVDQSKPIGFLKAA